MEHVYTIFCEDVYDIFVNNKKSALKYKVFNHEKFLELDANLDEDEENEWDAKYLSLIPFRNEKDNRWKLTSQRVMPYNCKKLDGVLIQHIITFKRDVEAYDDMFITPLKGGSLPYNKFFTSAPDWVLGAVPDQIHFRGELPYSSFV